MQAALRPLSMVVPIGYSQVARYGGDIIKFCGDAVMILWPAKHAAPRGVLQVRTLYLYRDESHSLLVAFKCTVSQTSSGLSDEARLVFHIIFCLHSVCSRSV